MTGYNSNELNTNFNQILNFQNITTTTNQNGTPTKTYTTFRSIKGRIEQVSPFQIVNGVQDEIRKDTTFITTRYFPEVSSTDCISVKCRISPSREVVNQTYVVNNISYVGTENRYVVLMATLIVPNSSAYNQNEGNTNG